MPYANAAERKAHVKAKRLADPEFNAQYLAKRRAQKARARIRKREAKPPRIPKPYCAHGHPRTANNLTPHGACKECRRAYKKRVRDAKPKAVRIHSPKPTRAQVRERERITRQNAWDNPWYFPGLTTWWLKQLLLCHPKSGKDDTKPVNAKT